MPRLETLCLSREAEEIEANFNEWAWFKPSKCGMGSDVVKIKED
jgi:hypothetical protein